MMANITFTKKGSPGLAKLRYEMFLNLLAPTEVMQNIRLLPQKDSLVQDHMPDCGIWNMYFVSEPKQNAIFKKEYVFGHSYKNSKYPSKSTKSIYHGQ